MKKLFKYKNTNTNKSEENSEIETLDKILTKDPNNNYNNFFHFLAKIKNSTFFVKTSIFIKKKYEKYRA